MNDIVKLVILGSTGSIGKQALQVVDRHPEKFRVVGLAARDEVAELARQIDKYHPLAAAIGDDKYYSQLKDLAGHQTKILGGSQGLCELAAMEEVDTVLVSVSGAVGIQPTLAAIARARRIALANKETLVAAGNIVMNSARETGAVIIPVDSEHSAIFQCLEGEEKFLKRIWLTASGGPFRQFSPEQLATVTVDMALNHPNWNMGPKITVDSATLMNKGLEVIEAHHLFAVDYDDIEVLVQRESVIHSMVELVDGSFLGHLGAADMRIPIQYALTYPERLASPARHLDFTQLGSIHFEKPDYEKFPALKLACNAGRQGGTMPAVMNAANEVAVHSFLRSGIKFTSIPHLVEEVMLRHNNIARPDLQAIMDADRWARSTCMDFIKREVVR